MATKLTPRTLTIHGIEKPMKVYAEEFGVPYPTVYVRKVKYGLPDPECLKPVKVKTYEYKGKQYTRRDIAHELGLSLSAVDGRIRKYNGDMVGIMETPVRTTRMNYCVFPCDECPFPDCIR